MTNRQDAMKNAEYEVLLSRLMDGDLDEFSTQRLLKQIEVQPSLRTTWQRYHISRQAISGSGVSFAGLSIADRVREELEQHGSVPVRRGFWLQQIRPFAVAASDACFGVLVGIQWQQQTVQPVTSVAASAVPTVRSMPVMPIDAAGLQAIPASFGQSQVLRSPAPVPIEGLYQELARQRLELYSGHHAAAGALHTPATLMTGTLAKAEAEAVKR